MVTLFVLLATAEAADVARGQSLYSANCTACHGAKADGKGPAAVALNPKPTDFTAAAYWAKVAAGAEGDAQIAAAIRAGRPGTSMTGFTQLTEADVADVVGWLRTLAPKP